MKSGGTASVSNRKRKQGQRHFRRRQNPSRGGPAILLTCEQGREKKCEREGLEMLRYYLEIHRSRVASNLAVPAVSVEKPTLDDELETLRARKDKHDDTFQVYDTGCRGTVVVMCALPDCSLIPPLNSSKDRTETKRARTDGLHAPPLWDPVQTVRSVVEGLVSNDTDAPGSRFISRMIPIQATCYSSLEEVQEVTGSLLDLLIPTLAPIPQDKEPRSFGIVFKRRNCTHLTRQVVIEALAIQITKRTSWKVKLREPDFTIMVEVCKTLCGVSILPSGSQTVAPNFNLATLRANDGAASE